MKLARGKVVGARWALDTLGRVKGRVGRARKGAKRIEEGGWGVVWRAVRLGGGGEGRGKEVSAWGFFFWVLFWIGGLVEVGLLASLAFFDD